MLSRCPKLPSRFNENTKRCDKAWHRCGFTFWTLANRTKLLECEEVIGLETDEFDVVINIGPLKSGNYNTVRHERDKIVSNESTFIVKSILEVSQLYDEIVEGINICYDLGVAFGKAT